MNMRDLYQDLIVDHNRSPRNFRRMDNATRSLQGFNPLCGDKLTLYVLLDGDVITDVSFEGSGCAISVASASLMTEKLKGQTIQQAETLFGKMHDLLTGTSEADAEQLGKLAALGGVKAYPMRVKCATLSWHTLHAVLANEQEPVTTE